MSDNVRFTVTANDQASDDFQRIGAAATKMGQQAQAAGKAASTGMTPVGPAAQKAERELANLERTSKRVKVSAVEVGAALGTLVTGLAKVGQATVSQERQIDGIRRAYGRAADEVLAFSEEIQDSTRFSNDAARESALAISSLAQNYGMTADQIQKVVEISADLAQIHGIDLVDASRRVAGALRGEGEAAELLGLNMSDAAVAAAALDAGITNWASPGAISEAEKAAFRYNLVLEQTAFAQGAAADAAESAAGRSQQFVNAIQDQVQAFGGLLGPVSASASVLGDYGLATIGAGAAIGNLVTVSRAAAQGIQALRASSALATVALGPVGLAAAGVAAVVALGEMTDWFGLASDGANDYEQAVTRAKAATQLLDETIYGLRSNPALFAQGQEIEAQLKEVITALGLYRDEYESLIDFRDAHPNWTPAEIDETWGNQFGEDVLRVTNQLGATQEQIDRVVQITNDLIGRFDDAGVNSTELANDLDGLFDRFQDGEINAQQFVSELERMLTGFNELYVTVPQATGAVDGLTAALSELVGVNLADFDLDIFLRNLGAAQREARDSGGVTGFIVGLGEAAGEAGREINDELRAAILGLSPELAQVKTDLAAQAEALRAAEQAVVDYIASGENLLQLLLDSGHELSGEQSFLRGVIQLDNALGALATTYEIIIGGTERLGATSADLAQWAESLKEAGATGPTLDALNQIIATNADVQADVLAIQQAQAPYLAALQADTAAYVDTLAQQDAQQQRNVLTMMDANSQQQLAALYAAATKAEMGELGSQGTQYVNDMAASLKVTNPLLYDMLVSTGAIKESADGIEFNFDEVDASALVTTLDELNDTLGDLIDVIDDLNGKTIRPNVDEGFLAKLREAANLAKGGFAMGVGPGDGTGGAGMAGASGFGPGDGTGGQGTTLIAYKSVIDTAAFYASLADMETAVADTRLMVTADNSQAIQVFYDTEGAIVGVANGEYIIRVQGDPTDATNDIELVNRILNDINGTIGVVYVEGDNSQAVGAVNDASYALSNLDGSSATIYAYADTSAARWAIDSLTGYQGSAVIDIIPRAVGSAFSALGFRDGGVVGFRDGGVVGYDAAALDGIVTNGGMRSILVGEAGPEILNVPAGSSVVPAPMTNAKLGSGRGGRELNFNFYGPVYGADDLQQMIGQAVRSAQYQGAL